MNKTQVKQHMCEWENETTIWLNKYIIVVYKEKKDAT